MQTYALFHDEKILHSLSCFIRIKLINELSLTILALHKSEDEQTLINTSASSLSAHLSIIHLPI